METTPDNIIEALSNHIGLPAQLPGGQDLNSEEIGEELIQRLIDAVEYIISVTEAAFMDKWKSLYRSLKLSLMVNDNGALSPTTILLTLQELAGHDFVLLHITEQNAGITVKLLNEPQDGVSEEALVFEVSEASPLSKDVLACSNALVWDFPSSAVALPLSVYKEYDFKEQLSEFLAQASNESVKQFAAHTSKANSQAYDCRDTVDPVIITGILMTILKNRGTQIFPPLLRKRVRDDVCWDGSGLKPWRRSPMWLLIRVAVERHLRSSMGPEIGRVQYKLLMCLFHSRFLSEYSKESVKNPEVLDHLNKKLVVRIDKLFREEANLDEILAKQFAPLYGLLNRIFETSVNEADKVLKEHLALQRKTQPRDTRRIPRFAPPESCFLKMLNSQSYINEVVNAAPGKNPVFISGNTFNIQDYEKILSTGNSDNEIINFYLKLVELEFDIKKELEKIPTDMKNLQSCQENCVRISDRILSYIDTVGNFYDGNSEQKSQMLLLVLELWIEMDKCVTKTYSLIEEYSPGIPSEILNVFLVATLDDLERLRRIQSYLNIRQKKSKNSSLTIFDQPSEDCFAVRYFGSSSNNSDLTDSLRAIEKEAEKDRKAKEKDLSKKSKSYKYLVEKESLMTHDGNYVTPHNPGKCVKCFHQRAIRRSKITIHEWPLPTDSVSLKTVLFELNCTKDFIAYRDTSWRIIAILASNSREKENSTPEFLLRDYRGLFKYHKSPRNSKFVLASKTKNFMQTQYDQVKLPARVSDVCVPNGANYRYYDCLRQFWPPLSQKPSFAHQCDLFFPEESLYSFLNNSPRIPVDRPGPSSYSIIANQIERPTGLPAHEYNSLKSLFIGYEQRWIQILIELGSSNINFRSESGSILMNLISLQAGPMDKISIRGQVNLTFQNHEFCSRLVDLIRGHLNDISSTIRRREIYFMDTLITLALKIYELGNSKDRQEGLNLVQIAREITSRWLYRFRIDIEKSKTQEELKVFTCFAVHTALLCKRTFVVYVGSSRIPESDLKIYMDCSISIQTNLTQDLSSLSASLKAILIRDLRIAWNIREVLRKSLSMPLLISVLSDYIPHLSYSTILDDHQFRYLQETNGWFILIETRQTLIFKRQEIVINLLTGYLLVDGKKIGGLPDEWKKYEVFKRLFGNMAIHTWPSELIGMDYRLYRPINGQAVHFGTRNGRKVIRVLSLQDHFELLPSEIFSGSNTWDFPKIMIDGCTHWLNFTKNRIEIRTVSNPWEYRPRNWSVDLSNKVATFRISYNYSQKLIDPHSELFRAIVNVFHDFEKPNEFLAVQPSKGPTKIYFPRLKLDFKINENNRFECYSLNSEIDINQDIKTWYGLRSKLVLREVALVTLPSQKVSRGQRKIKLIVPTHRRTVLVPTGNISLMRTLSSVEIRVSNTGEYARFMINETLGRIEALDFDSQYLKAYYHAITSNLEPDPLTGRTGTEEAFHCLESAYCQPALPLTLQQKSILKNIANLSPQRDYYPKGLKGMQVTLWNKELSISIQHDGYRALINQIFEKSEKLSQFFEETADPSNMDRYVNQELSKRNQVRRSLYSREKFKEISDYEDVSYSGHSLQDHLSCTMNVRICTIILQNWSRFLPQACNLHKLLQGWSNFQGFGEPLTYKLLSELLEKDLPDFWGSLVFTLRCASKKTKNKLIFLLGIISFRKQISMDTIIPLIGFAISDKLKAIKPPSWPFYERYQKNEKPTIKKISNLIESFPISKYQDEIEDQYKTQRKNQALSFAKFILEQWPCTEPTHLGSPELSFFKLDEIMDSIRPEWFRLFKNWELSCYLSKVQSILNDLQIQSLTYDVKDNPKDLTQIHKIFFQRNRQVYQPKMLHELLEADNLSDERLLFTTQSHAKKNEITWNHESISSDISSTTDINALESIFKNLTASDSMIEKRYAEDLMQSLHAFHSKNLKSFGVIKIQYNRLHEQIEDAKLNVETKLKLIQEAFDRLIPVRSKWLKRAGLWPCITPVSLLESIRSKSTCKLNPTIKKFIIDYGISITKLQKLYRIHQLRLKQDDQSLSDEVMNTGHTNWDPLLHPDWLLLEIDGNILIRPVQVDVANETINPCSEKNSVLQMNMGQGKTSCIMPMAAVALADGNSLTRVVVPRALLAQNMQLFQLRLGGLLGREIQHIPFSRKLLKKEEIADKYSKQLKYIQKSRGIILTLQEHVLSFKLSGYQVLSDDNILEAKKFISTQKWISSTSRDIIDECDEILSIRTQLIYPSGTQRTIDGHPDRWEVIECLLKLVNFQVDYLEKNSAERGFTIIHRVNGGFPLFFFVENEAEELLMTLLTNQICSEQSQIISDYSPHDLSIIKEFISRIDVSKNSLDLIESITKDKPIARKILYLLRGLLAHDILLSCLKKRWNVQYGLHPDRDPIAVPYHAKGCPSDQSEWGHPDVAIILTCLAFYYDGISFALFRKTLSRISQSDDSIQQYNRLILGASLPDSIKDWNNINIEDEPGVKELWSYLRFNVNVINFFLNHFVFPLHAKQFEYKLQASGWDIPAFNSENTSSQQKSPVSLTTGFSGTNDWKRLLPATISQQDLSALSHTNAEVLTYLLQERNKGYYLAADRDGKRLSERELLHEIAKYKITVLLDAGAQIMEMDNLSLVKAWLEIDTTAPAAFYFDKENRPQVLYRGGQRVPFYSSTYSENLQNCLVYLDQAHTRGTDLKLQAYVRGALTLGPNQTKDPTVQAAMRLRKLGTTQSITFFAPPEVHKSILNLQMKKPTEKLTSFDVVSWLLKQTCISIEMFLPLYYIQGLDFCRRTQASLSYPNIFKSSHDRSRYLSIILETENNTIEELYGTKKKSLPELKWNSRISKYIKQIRSQCKGLMNSGSQQQIYTFQEMEQEKQDEFEAQFIRNVEEPYNFEALIFPGLNSDIRSFIKNGKVNTFAKGYEFAFDFISRTLLGRKYDIRSEFTSQKLFVSIQFGRLVHQPIGRDIDHLNRPVNWILWSPTTEVAMVIIPEEVEIILPILRKKSCAVHLLTYAAPVTRKMLPFNDFGYFNLRSLCSSWIAPSWLRIEVGILAGRLYFDYSEYDAVLGFLGVKEFDGRISQNLKELSEIKSCHLKKELGYKSFTSKPLSFLQEWLALRGQGQDFSHTPMGFICQGKPILNNHSICTRIKSISTSDENNDQDTVVIDSSKVDEDDQDDLIGFEDIEDFEQDDNYPLNESKVEEDLMRLSDFEDED